MATEMATWNAGMQAGVEAQMEAETEAYGMEAQMEAEGEAYGMEAGVDAETEPAGAGMEDRVESVQLAAYYVLGDTAETEALPLPDACLRLIVLVHSQELEHDAFQHDRNADVVIFAKLFNHAAGMRVDVARDANKPLVEHLVRQAKPKEAVARLRLGANKRSIWQ